MSQQRLPVRKIREVLRLKAAGISDRQIAASVGSARSTVQECLRRAREAGLTWPLPDEPDDGVLEARLYPCVPAGVSRPPPDFAHVHTELMRPGVTRMLLWQEYKATEPQGWQYSVFCEQYSRWRCRQELVLRQNHAPGEKVFVDYAGQTVAIIDRYSGESAPAQIFVAVLGCSNYTYICATRTQSLPDWLAAHVQALEFFGGVPAAVVPDNLKSGVKRAHRYEPEINPSYQDFAEHYALAILPARVRKPRDKAKVEAGVLIVERWVLARLRNRTFFSLGELNLALTEFLVSLNTRAFKKLAGSRLSRFKELDQPALRPLPLRAYEFSEWKKAKVHPDYHVEVGRAYYSVPYRFIGERVDVRLTARAVEIFSAGDLIAAHPRAAERGKRLTRRAHRPKRHIAIIDQSLARVLERATHIGPATLEVLRLQSYLRKHPEETLRSAQGILRLAQDFAAADLERACERALVLKSYSYRAIRIFIERPAVTVVQSALDLAHENVRGPDYFQ